MTILIPERRFDRNNKSVTRWVKAATDTTQKMNIPCPSTPLSPQALSRAEAISSIYDFSFVSVNGELCDIYDMEIADSDAAYARCCKGLESLTEEALGSLSSAAQKADSPVTKEIVANIVYRIGDSSTEESELYSLLALHSETFVELLDTKFQHVHDTEVMQWMYTHVQHAIANPIDDISIEQHSEAVLTLGLLFPYNYFQDSPRIVRSMVNDREGILENHTLVIESEDHIMGRKELDLGILLDIEKYFGPLKRGAL